MSNKEGISTGKGYHPFSEFSNSSEVITRISLWSGSTTVTGAQGAQINEYVCDRFIVFEIDGERRTTPIKIPHYDLSSSARGIIIPILDGISLSVESFDVLDESTDSYTGYIVLGLVGDKVVDGTTVTITKIYEEC